MLQKSLPTNQPTGLEAGSVCLQLNFRSFQFTQGRLQLLGGLVREGFLPRGKIGTLYIEQIEEIYE